MAFLLARQMFPGWPAISVKVASILLLAALAFRQRERLLATALVISAVGDAVLAFPAFDPMTRLFLFMAGMAVFFQAHFCYIAFFGLRYQGLAIVPGWRKAVALALPAVMVAMLAFLGPKLDFLLWPVVVYSLALTGMAASAQLAPVRTPWVALGGLSFVLSDALLGVARFSGPFPFSHELIWLTYYTAQAGICVGWVKGRGETAATPSPL